MIVILTPGTLVRIKFDLQEFELDKIVETFSFSLKTNYLIRREVVNGSEYKKEKRFLQKKLFSKSKKKLLDGNKIIKLLKQYTRGRNILRLGDERVMTRLKVRISQMQTTFKPTKLPKFKRS